MNNSTMPRAEREDARARAQLQLDLPSPRIWEPKHLAAFFGFSVHWVDKLMKSDDPPPHCPGLGRRRFDTQSRAFRDWLARHGVDIGE